ncbi:MAG: hypothetical protein U0350_07250 [Caldilineaceae bacterium]
MSCARKRWWPRVGAARAGGGGAGCPINSARRLTPPVARALNDLEAGILKEATPDIDRLLDRPVPAAPTLLGEAGQQRLALTITDLFQRQAQPLVLLLEDLQWSSESLLPLRS